MLRLSPLKLSQSHLQSEPIIFSSILSPSNQMIRILSGCRCRAGRDGVSVLVGRMCGGDGGGSCMGVRGLYGGGRV